MCSSDLAVVRIFQGQPYHAGVSYMRDIGILQGLNRQLSLLPSDEDGIQLGIQNLIDDSGFKNEALQLTDEQILRNIRTLQNESDIHQSTQLVDPMGRCSLSKTGIILLKLITPLLPLSILRKSKLLGIYLCFSLGDDKGAK